MATQEPKVFPPPVDWDDLYPGRFIKAADFKGAKVTLTIATVRIEELIGDKGPQIKGIISFEKTDKSLALNKTNGTCIKAMFGKKVQTWIGHKITLFASPYDETGDCIRVWGSPELKADMEVTVALPRKRPFSMIMHTVAGKPTGSVPGTGTAKQAPPSPATDPAPEREPGADDEYDPELSRALDKQLADQ